MYTCPTDDIHSVYLDGELPNVYLQQYEAHTKTCAGCAKKLESLRAVRKLLRKDSDALTLDAIAMEESFKRLGTKLRYSKNTAKAYAFPKSLSIPAAAAAAAFITLLPFGKGMPKTGGAPMPEIAAIVKPQVSIPKRNVIINGNIMDNFSRNVSMGGASDFTYNDVFRPHFDCNDEDIIAIRVSMPYLNDSDSEIMEIQLPVNTILGQLK